MIMEDGSVIHYNNPLVQASMDNNLFAISGETEKKEIVALPPGIRCQLGPESLVHLEKYEIEFEYPR